MYHFNVAATCDCFCEFSVGVFSSVFPVQSFIHSRDIKNPITKMMLIIIYNTLHPSYHEKRDVFKRNTLHSLIGGVEAQSRLKRFQNISYIS